MDLIEIHGFHNIRGEIHKILWKSNKSTRISEQNIANIANNSKQI